MSQAEEVQEVEDQEKTSVSCASLMGAGRDLKHDQHLEHGSSGGGPGAGRVEQKKQKSRKRPASHAPN